MLVMLFVTQVTFMDSRMKKNRLVVCRSFYTGIGIHDLKDDGTLGPEKSIHGFPEGSKLNFVTW